MKLRFSAEARDDLKAILRTGISLFGVKTAFEYDDRLKDVLRLIADNPALAPERTEFTPPVRVHPFRAHVIIYRVMEDHLLIIRVRHGREDWTSDFAPEEL